MATTSAPEPPETDQRGNGESRQKPWNCRHAYVAGTLRTVRTLDAPGVLWTCRLRDRAPAPLFTREECYSCRRWCARDGGASADWASGASDPAPSSPGPVGHATYRRGVAIVQEGAPADVLYTILSGTVKLFKATGSRRAIGLGISMAGSPLGPEWILQGSPFATMAVALESTTCIATPRRVVSRLVDAHPALLRELIREVSEHELNLMTRIAEVAGAGVHARFAHLFLDLASKVGVRQDGRVVIRIPLLRQDLADLTGTRVETTIRLMSRWEKQGLITTQAGGFVLRDIDALERLGSS